jgi:prepilin peptidase CpaA
MLHLMLQSWPSAITATMILASGIVLLLAAGHDVVSRTVPDWMSVLIAGFGLAASVADGRLFPSIPIGIGIFILMRMFWRFGWLGGADVKLLGAIGIVLPPGLLAPFVVAMSSAGAVHAISYMIARRVVTPPAPLPSYRPRARSLLPRGLRAERWRISRGGPLPYACAIAFGFLFVVL